MRKFLLIGLLASAFLTAAATERESVSVVAMDVEVQQADVGMPAQFIYTEWQVTNNYTSVGCVSDPMEVSPVPTPAVTTLSATTTICEGWHVTLVTTLKHPGECKVDYHNDLQALIDNYSSDRPLGVNYDTFTMPTEQEA